MVPVQVEEDEEVFYDIGTSFYKVLYSSNLEINGFQVIHSTAMINCRDLLRYVDPFSFNRTVNDIHIKKIKEDLLAMKVPHLFGTFTIVHNITTNEYRLIDGQHRVKAFSQILLDDIENKWELPCNSVIYSFDDHVNIEKSSIARHLFKIANKTFSFDIDNHSINDYISEIIDILTEDPVFKSNIITSGNRPRIMKNELYKELVTHFKPIKQIPVKEVINYFKLKNNHISLMNVNKLFGTQKKVEKYQTQYDKAKKYNFFLNLEVYPPEKWIKELVLSINSDLA